MKRPGALTKRYTTGRASALEKRYGRGPGRPAFADGTARTTVFSLKLSEEDRATIEAAAGRAGMPLSRWAREVLLAKATEMVDP